MKTDVPNRHFEFDNVDEERLARLFTLAIARHKGRELETATMSLDDEAIVSEIIFLLKTIDASWQSVPSELDRGRALFLKKLAAEEPDHPWVQQSVVTTLGELFEANQDAFPSFSEETTKALSQDPTPISQLLDVATRTELLGIVIRAASVPARAVRDFVMGVNRVLGAISSISRPEGQVFVYTRKKRGMKRQEDTPESDAREKE